MIRNTTAAALLLATQGLGLALTLPAAALSIFPDEAGAEALPLPRDGFQFWGVGNTGVTCYTTPCPWRGVFPIAQTGERGWPLSRENSDTPPAMLASAADRDRIETTYAEHRCLIVEGRFEDGILIVNRILGDC